jgi:hypothetical protein
VRVSRQFEPPKIIESGKSHGCGQEATQDGSA